MVKNFFVLAFVLFVVAATGWLVVMRVRANNRTSAASIGVAGGNKGVSTIPFSTPVGSVIPAETVLEGGLRVRDDVIGGGAEATSGMSVAVHYTGRLADGTVFDSSRGNNSKPFVFSIGAGEVIRGWDVGVVGMRVGGKRTLLIPPALAYGNAGAGGVIPPNATLTFDIELLAVQTAGKTR